MNKWALLEVGINHVVAGEGIATTSYVEGSIAVSRPSHGVIVLGTGPRHWVEQNRIGLSLRRETLGFGPR